MTIKARITAEVDYTWFSILDQITKNQDGFVWVNVERFEEDN